MPQTLSEAYRTWSETAPTFSFKAIEAILGIVFDVAPEKRKAFTARLQQLQKLGLPPETNVGRGKRVAYQGWQLCDMQLYLDLIDAGVTPALIASRFKQTGFYRIDGDGRFGEAAAKSSTSYFVDIRLNALEHLTLATTSLTDEDATFNSVSSGSDASDVVISAKGKPGVMIDIGARLRKLRAAIAVIQPEAAEQDLFMPLAEAKS